MRGVTQGREARWPSSRYRPPAGSIPDAPGVYRFLDGEGRPVYVGKAKRLKDRLSSYFGDPSKLHPRTQAMLEAAVEVRWTVVASEVEALVLEQEWIHAFEPRFNVRMRDGRSYPSLALTLRDEYPRVMVWRGKRRGGIKYFGPYPHGRDVSGTLDSLLRVFPVRSCSPGYFERHRRENRVCLLADIGKCSGPCAGRVSAEEHRHLVEGMGRFLGGDTKGTLKRLEAEMRQAAQDLEFEKAARRRDDLEALKRIVERQSIVLGDDVDADVFASASDELQRAWYGFFVRGGVVRGVRNWVVEVDPETEGDRGVGTFLARAYSEMLTEGGESTSDVPPEVLVADAPEDQEALEEWLSGKRGRKVRVVVPRRGSRRELLGTVQKNAGEVLAQVRMQRSTDLSSRTNALNELAEALELAEAPLRIECMDVAHTQGSGAYASLVTFEDGLPRKDSYRTYRISPANAGNDVASVAEVVTRRFGKTSRPRLDVDPETGEVLDNPLDTAKSVADSLVLPQLLLVDGGAPQVAAVQEALDALGVELPVAGLAKRLEEVWVPGDPDPVVLPRSSEALYLLQRMRDEAHRVANGAHARSRRAGVQSSTLEQIPGLGPSRRRALLKQFGSAKRVAAASVEELQKVEGVGPVLARSILESLSPSGGVGEAAEAGEPTSGQEVSLPSSAGRDDPTA